MKKFIILALMVLVGVSLVTASFAAEARTITHKTKIVPHTDTVVIANGATLYSVNGYANSASAIYGIYDTTTTALAHAAITAATENVCKIEGGEATQYDSIPTIDFGEDGIIFNSGIVVLTTTADLVIEYA